MTPRTGALYSPARSLGDSEGSGGGGERRKDGKGRCNRASAAGGGSDLDLASVYAQPQQWQKQITRHPAARESRATRDLIDLAALGSAN